MNVLYVTSFTPALYAKTGRLLVKSFMDTQPDGTLLICPEAGVTLGEERRAARIVVNDLDNSAFLAEWLAANRDIIPVSMGGTAAKCACQPSGKTRHQPNCLFQWFNRNASRWFRKIVALDVARSSAEAEAIVWVDCDCRFTQPLPAPVLASLFGEASVLFHKGPDREVVESGVIAFKLDHGGRHLLHTVIERYRSGAFRADRRWDDGYQFGVVIDACPEVASKDLGGRSSTAQGDVLPSSPFGRYLRHDKGIHSKLKLMV